MAAKKSAKKAKKTAKKTKTTKKAAKTAKKPAKRKAAKKTSQAGSRQEAREKGGASICGAGPEGVREGSSAGRRSLAPRRGADVEPRGRRRRGVSAPGTKAPSGRRAPMAREPGCPDTLRRAPNPNGSGVRRHLRGAGGTGPQGTRCARFG